MCSEKITQIAKYATFATSRKSVLLECKDSGLFEQFLDPPVCKQLIDGVAEKPPLVGVEIANSDSGHGHVEAVFGLLVLYVQTVRVSVKLCGEIDDVPDREPEQRQEN